MRLRMLSTAVASVLAIVNAQTAFAQFADESWADSWGQAGYGRLINNDFLGDLQDRDQSGSYVSSRIFSKRVVKAMPTRAGEVLEFRLQADIKSPDNLRTARVGDRPYAGTVTLGLHTHYEQAGYQISMGAELAIVGPQTGLDRFQVALHDLLGVSALSQATVDAQIGNSVFPGVVVEMGRDFKLSDRGTLRPFVEARAGVETMVRAGVDFTLGQIGREPLLIRDGISGQRYRTILDKTPSLAFVVGADTAVVSESAYLPSARGYTLTDRRDRARLGLHWQGKANHGFFGVTYLSKEYTTQTSSQLVGSIRLSFDF